MRQARWKGYQDTILALPACFRRDTSRRTLRLELPSKDCLYPHPSLIAPNAPLRSRLQRTLLKTSRMTLNAKWKPTMPTHSKEARTTHHNSKFAPNSKSFAMVGSPTATKPASKLLIPVIHVTDVITKNVRLLDTSRSSCASPARTTAGARLWWSSLTRLKAGPPGDATDIWLGAALVTAEAGYTIGVSGMASVEVRDVIVELELDFQ